MGLLSTKNIPRIERTQSYWTISDLYRWAVRNGVESIPVALYFPEDDVVERLAGAEVVETYEHEEGWPDKTGNMVILSNRNRKSGVDLNTGIEVRR